jgi:hypothetical protein
MEKLVESLKACADSRASMLHARKRIMHVQRHILPQIFGHVPNAKVNGVVAKRIRIPRARRARRIKSGIVESLRNVRS